MSLILTDNVKSARCLEATKDAGILKRINLSHTLYN